MIEQNENAVEAQTKPHFSLSQKVGIGASGSFIAIGGTALLHAPPPLAVAGFVGACVLAVKSPNIYQEMRNAAPFLPDMSQHARQSRAPGEWTLTDRLMGRHLQVQPVVEALEQPTPRTEEQHEVVSERVVDDSPVQKVGRNMVNLASDLQININEISGKAIFVCGIRRHGKTTLGARLAEQLGTFNIPMFIPDLEGDYISLAELLPRSIVAGFSGMARQYADQDFAPLDTAEQAFQLGYNILEYGYQVILDMNTYVDLDAAVKIQVNIIQGMFKWANDFPEKRVPACVYLDEAQRFLPQNLNDSVILNKELVQGLLKAYMDIIAIGGKRGISPVILTQRFAQVNNKIMAQSEVFFLMRQTHDGDLKRCMEYASDPITKEQIAKFAPGQGVYIATDGRQQVTHFHQRESDGSRSKSPQAEGAQRYATMSFSPTGQATRKSAQPVQQLPDLSPMYAAIVNMRASHFADEEIRQIVGMSEREYRHALVDIEDAGSSRPTSHKRELDGKGREVLVERRERDLWASRSSSRQNFPRSNSDDTERTSHPIPQMGIEKPVESREVHPVDIPFLPKGDDKIVPDDQVEDLLYWHRKLGNVNAALAKMGITNSRYRRHAAYLVEQKKGA